MKRDFLSLVLVAVLLARSPISQAHTSSSGGLRPNDRLLQFEENTPDIIYGQGVPYPRTRLLVFQDAGSRGSGSTVQIAGVIRDIAGRGLENSWVEIRDSKWNTIAATSATGGGSYSASVKELPEYIVSVYPPAILKGKYYSLNHMPQAKKVAPTGRATVTVDFELDYASQIILRSYNQNGTLMRMKDFGLWRMAYTTDLEERLAYGKRDFIHDVYSAQHNWDSDLMVPAILLPPNALRTIHVLWEVPGFGEVLVEADNDGKGFTSNAPGQVQEINFNLEAAKSQHRIIEEAYQSYIGHGYKISGDIGELLSKSRDALDKASHEVDEAVKAKHSNDALSYSLRAGELLEFEKAQTDIDAYRKGNCTIKFVVDDGSAVPSLRVDYNQIGHDFLFGVFDWNYDETTLDMMKKIGINYITIYYNWGTIEYDINGYTRIDRFTNYATQNGITASAHNLLYFTDIYNYASYPSDLKTMDFETVKRRSVQFVSDSVRRDGDRIRYWTIVNEANGNWANALNFTIEQMLDIIGEASGAVREANPQAEVIVNLAGPGEEFQASRYDLQGMYSYTPLEFIEKAQGKRVNYDIVGLQFYYGTMYSETGWPSRDMYSISKIMDWYGGQGKPIFITETSFPSQYTLADGQQGYWHGMPSEATKADYVRYFYTIAFSKPYIHAVNWWDGDDIDEWYPTAGLITFDHKPKPAYTTLADLISSWTTKGSSTVNEHDGLRIRGFGGDYCVTISGEGLAPEDALIHIDERGDRTYTIALRRAGQSYTLVSRNPCAASSATTASSTTTQPTSQASSRDVLTVEMILAGAIVMTATAAFLMSRKTRPRKVASGF